MLLFSDSLKREAMGGAIAEGGESGGIQGKKRFYTALTGLAGTERKLI